MFKTDLFCLEPSCMEGLAAEGAKEGYLRFLAAAPQLDHTLYMRYGSPFTGGENFHFAEVYGLLRLSQLSPQFHCITDRSLTWQGHLGPFRISTS